MIPTPITQIIQKLELQIEKSEQVNNPKYYSLGLQKAIDLCKESLELEKKFIKEAIESGYVIGHGNGLMYDIEELQEEFEVENYFNKKFTQKTK